MAEHTPDVQPWRERLVVPTYTVKAAASLARTNLTTVSYWLSYRAPAGPLVPERPAYWNLSWVQLVEIAFVATMRRHGVSLQRVRRAHGWLAQAFKVEYPFAVFRLKTDGAHILMRADDEGAQGCLIVADERGQMAWERTLSERYVEFEYEHELALRWHPRGDASPVTLDPRIAFGMPAVRGIPTRVIRGRFDAGDKIEEIGEDLGINRGLVIQALAFEGVGLDE